jgi:hypothetical protein
MKGTYPGKGDYTGEYTMVTRSPSGPAGATETGFVAAIGSNVFVSRPVPGKPLPAHHFYPNEAAATRDGWRSDVELRRTFFGI